MEASEDEEGVDDEDEEGDEGDSEDESNSDDVSEGSEDDDGETCNASEVPLKSCLFCWQLMQISCSRN